MRSKKLIPIILIIVSSLMLFGCGNNAPEKTPEEENKEQDAQTTASIVDKEEAFKKAISKDGTWIIIALKDLSFNDDLEVEGEFRDKGDKDNELYRKIALYDQDNNNNIADRYTITTPKLIIKSPNTNIVGGIIKGDVEVEAEGFTLSDATIDGNLIFADEDQRDEFKLDNDSKVTGETQVK